LAATKIGAVFRGKKARKEVEELKEARNFVRTDASNVDIQKSTH